MGFALDEIYCQTKLEKRQTKDNRVTVRLDDKMTKALDGFCQTSNINRSEAVRSILEIILMPAAPKKD
jgi:metal-responsive CopG/Arc/MetJ family transcriptional regulator